MENWLGNIIILIPVPKQEDLTCLYTKLTRVSFITFTDIRTSISIFQKVEELFVNPDLEIQYKFGRTIIIGVYGEYDEDDEEGTHFSASAYSIISCTDYENTLYVIQMLIYLYSQ